MPYANGNKVYNIGLDNRKTFICNECSIEYKRYKYSKFCSKKCYHIFESKERTGIGNPMFGKKWSEKRLNITVPWKGKIPKNFIRIQKLAWLKPRRGKDSNMWKGGITPEHHLIRQSKEYINWRNEVYKKDYFTCRECGYKGMDIIAHYLKLFSEYPELRFDVGNGIVLCRRCHFNIHHNKKAQCQK